MSKVAPPGGEPSAYLDHYPSLEEAPHRVLIVPIPFRIGRGPTTHFVIYSAQVSKEHAEIYRVGKEFHVRDLGSTNGTFVNGKPIHDSPLADGDILHLAHKEFRFGCKLPSLTTVLGECRTERAENQVPTNLIRGGDHLREMIAGNQGRAVFQPIMHLATQDILGFEALGRGTHSELSMAPGDLFPLADQYNLAGDLSGMFRTIAVQDALSLPDRILLFLNLHPAEIKNDTLLHSLGELRKNLKPSQQIVLEVHEAVVTDLFTMHRLRSELRDLGIGLAYDDFGAGQSRLKELAEVPPDFLKLDLNLIRGIDGSEARQDLVRALCRVSLDLGVQTIAEGIETEKEAKVCRDLGCPYGQGYRLGRPLPVALMSFEQEAASGVKPGHATVTFEPPEAVRRDARMGVSR